MAQTAFCRATVNTEHESVGGGGGGEGVEEWGAAIVAV